MIDLKVNSNQTKGKKRGERKEGEMEDEIGGW